MTTTSSADAKRDRDNVADFAASTMLTKPANCSDAAAVAGAMWASLLISHVVLNTK